MQTDATTRYCVSCGRNCACSAVNTVVISAPTEVATPAEVSVRRLSKPLPQKTWPGQHRENWRRS